MSKIKNHSLVAHCATFDQTLKVLTCVLSGSEWNPPATCHRFSRCCDPTFEHRMWQNIVENHSLLETKTHLQGHGFHMIAIFASKLSFFYHWKLQMLYMLLWILPGFWYSSVLNQRSIMISWRKSKPKTNKLGCHPFESCNVTSFWEVRRHGSLEGRLII